MAVETLETRVHHNSNGSPVSGFGQRTDGHALDMVDERSFIGHGDSEELLEIDLDKYRADAGALLEISVNLQKLGKRQKADIQRLQEYKTSNLVITPSKTSSRRRTDETQSSRATTMSEDHDETVVVFSASDNELTIRHRRSMKDTDYLQADLPPFHWWSDRLHIYFERRSSTDSSTYENPQVVVVRNKIKDSSSRDVKLVRTVRLTQLGFRIRVRRMLGQIKFIYVLSPRPPVSRHTKEIPTQTDAHSARSGTKTKLVA